MTEKCPKCGSKEVEPKWCPNCYGTGVDPTTGDECRQCTGEMVCNDCFHVWEE